MSYSPPPAVPASALAYAPRMRWLERIVLVGAGTLLIGLLVTAARLTPSPRGMGTHEQLGLPPCTLVQWMGMRCPSCGMTTSWAYATKGRLIASCRANAGGALLAVLAMVCGPWMVASGLAGRWLIAPPHEWMTLAVGLLIFGITIIQWTIRLSLGW